VNRTAAAIGLALSLSLHSGLFLLAGRPSQPVVATRLEVTLQQTPRQQTETVGQTTDSSDLEQPRPRPAVPSPPPERIKEPNPQPQPQKLSEAPPPRQPKPAAEPVLQPPPAPRPVPSEASTPSTPVNPEPTSETESAAKPVSAHQAIREVDSIPATEHGELTPPVYIPSKRPYPRLAKLRGWEGTVDLQVVITAAGRVKQVTLEHSSGYPLLDREALKQIRTARFKPARKQGKAIELSVLLPVVFELK
jgi:periplasmic protein TonB